MVIVSVVKCLVGEHGNDKGLKINLLGFLVKTEENE